jgi:hypothetical protein
VVPHVGAYVGCPTRSQDTKTTNCWTKSIMTMTDLQQTAAILWLSTQACVVCRGTKADDGAQSDVLPPDFGPCPDCLGIDGKPTGARFHTLRVECDLPYARGHDDHVDDCQGRGWFPIGWRDEYTIRLALRSNGYRVEHKQPIIGPAVWEISAPHRDTCTDPVLAVAAKQAVEAEEARYEGYRWVI